MNNFEIVSTIPVGNFTLNENGQWVDSQNQIRPFGYDTDLGQLFATIAVRQNSDALVPLAQYLGITLSELLEKHYTPHL